MGECRAADADVRGTAATKAAGAAAVEPTDAAAKRAPLPADIDLDRSARGERDRRRRAAAEARREVGAGTAALRPVEVEGRLGDARRNGPGLRRAGVVEGLGLGGGRGGCCERGRRERHRGERNRARSGELARGRRPLAQRPAKRMTIVHRGLPVCCLPAATLPQPIRTTQPFVPRPSICPAWAARFPGKRHHRHGGR